MPPDSPLLQYLEALADLVDPSGALLSVRVTTASLADLEAFDVSHLDTGQAGVVESVGAVFTLRAPGPAVDGITILEASDGRVWLRGPTLIAMTAAAQAVWDFDPAGGNDEASGAPGSPVQTFAEIVRRLGTPRPTLPYGQSFAVRQVSPQPAGVDPIIFEPFLPGGGNLSYVGTLAAVGAPFAAGAVTPKVRAAGASPLQVAGFPGAAAAPMLVENVTRGSFSAIDAIAGGVATLCQPWKTPGLTTIQFPIQAGAVVYIEDDTWAPGDSLQLWQAPNANLKLWQARGADAVVGGAKAVTWLQNVHVPDPSGTIGQSLLLIGGEQNHVVSCCSFEPFMISDIYTSGIGIDGTSAQVFINCVFAGGGQFRSKSVAGGSSNSALRNYTNFNDGSIIDGDIILHGATNVKGRYSDLGCALIAQGGTMQVDKGAVLILQPEFLPGGCCLYGATFAVNGPNSAVGRSGTYVNDLKVTTITMDGLTTGSARVGSAWTDGIALTSANLDAFGGLQNTSTGSRFA